MIFQKCFQIDFMVILYGRLSIFFYNNSGQVNIIDGNNGDDDVGLVHLDFSIDLLYNVLTISRQEEHR